MLKKGAPLMIEALLMMMMKALAPVLMLMMALAPVKVMMQDWALLDLKSKQRALMILHQWEPVQERKLEVLLPVGQEPVQDLLLEVLPQRVFLQQKTHLLSWALALRQLEVLVDENLKSTELEEKVGDVKEKLQRN